jgi:SSS family solute:Na+ symporter
MKQLDISDIAVFVGYLSAMLVIGLVAGRRKKDTASEFFITNKALPWYVIGFSFIAATVSSQ